MQSAIKKIGVLVFLLFLEDNETSAVAKSPRASYQRSNKPARVDEGSSSGSRNCSEYVGKR